MNVGLKEAVALSGSLDFTMSVSSLPYETSVVALVKQESRFETLNDRADESIDNNRDEMLILENAKLSMNIKGLKPPTEISKQLSIQSPSKRNPFATNTSDRESESVGQPDTGSSRRYRNPKNKSMVDPRTQKAIEQIEMIKKKKE